MSQQPSGSNDQSELREIVEKYSTIQANIRALRARNDRDGAIEEAQRGFAMLEEHTQGFAYSTDAANNLASLLGEGGQWAQAEPLFEVCAQVREKTLGTYHPSTATAFMMLGIAKLQLSKFDESERFL